MTTAVFGQDLVVTRLLGGGGLAHVYQVWSARRCAVFACKTLRDEWDDTAALSRVLTREGQVLRTVAHPRIVRLFEIGTDPRPYLLLEYLDGPRASDLLKQHGRLPRLAAVRLAMHVGASLLHVHRRGYLHLDVKPENVIVVGNRPVLFDFSLARRQSARHPAWRMGTRPNMAPEQCLRLPLSPATDVFGLGCLLYRLLSGERPFRTGLRDENASLETCYPQLVDDPLPLRQHQPHMPRGLEAIVMRCLRRDPSERYQEMDSLLRALAPFSNGGLPSFLDVSLRTGETGTASTVMEARSPALGRSGLLHLTVPAVRLGLEMPP